MFVRLITFFFCLGALVNALALPTSPSSTYDLSKRGYEQCKKYRFVSLGELEFENRQFYNAKLFAWFGGTHIELTKGKTVSYGETFTMDYDWLISRGIRVDETYRLRITSFALTAGAGKNYEDAWDVDGDFRLVKRNAPRWSARVSFTEAIVMRLTQCLVTRQMETWANP